MNTLKKLKAIVPLPALSLKKITPNEQVQKKLVDALWVLILSVLIVVYKVYKQGV